MQPQQIWRFGPSIQRPPSIPLNLPCCQFYLNDKVKWDFNPLPNWQLPEGQRFFIHLPVNMNPADITRDPSKALSKMLKQVEGKPAACVLHVGTNGSIDTIANRINKVKVPQSTLPYTLLLEPPAGDGNKIGGTWEELRLLFEKLDKTNNIGLCLDTQHLYGAGMCNFESAAMVQNLFDYSSSLGRIGLIHLNDSLVPFNSKVDRHESLGRGHIWGLTNSQRLDAKQQKESLAQLLTICHHKDIDVVSETSDFYSDTNFCQQCLTQAQAQQG
jgi:hypothetical protein